MTKRRKAILWGENDLLNQAMEMILTASQRDLWEVTRIPASEYSTVLVEHVKKTKPDLVILYRANACDSDPFLKLLEEKPELRALAELPESKVIIVSLENNVMQVYSKRSVTVRQVSDLLSIIEDRYGSELPDRKEVINGKTIPSD